MVEAELKEQREPIHLLARVVVVTVAFVLSLPWNLTYWGFVAAAAEIDLFGLVVIVSWSLAWGIVPGVAGMIVAFIRGYADKKGFALWCFTVAVGIHGVVSAAAWVIGRFFGLEWFFYF